jgi:magnesium-transporting ATPase (P-type)
MDNIKSKNIPLKLYQPLNTLVFLSFYSPIIIASIITSMSFIFQNFKGIIYLAFLLGICILRNYIYMMCGSPPINSTSNDICTSIQYSEYGNASFSAFVSSFTIMYLSYPMFSNNSPNFVIFSILLIYFFVDVFIKIYKKCAQASDLFLNVLLGLASSALIVTLMYAGGSGKYLFFNEISSNKDVCYMPKKQTFKCSVYKNGELISGPGN